MKKRSISIFVLLSAVAGAVIYLFCRKSECCCETPKVQKPYGTIQDRVKAVLKAQSESVDFTAETLLDELQEPRDSIESAFHQSIEQIIEQHRVKQAEELLRTTDDTISCIAETVGFGSSQALYRPFKKMYELAPSLYREKYRG